MKKHYLILGMLGVFLLVSGFFYKKNVLDYDFSKAKKIYERENQEERFEFEVVEIFVPNKEFKKLEKKAVKIVRVENENERIKLIFNQIRENSNFKVKYISNGSKEKVEEYFDSGIRLINIFIEGEDLYLNFNPRLKTSIVNKEQELFILYSIVNSLTSSPKYKRVKLLINNEGVNNLKYYNISGFLEQDLNI